MIPNIFPNSIYDGEPQNCIKIIKILIAKIPRFTLHTRKSIKIIKSSLHCLDYKKIDWTYIFISCVNFDNSCSEEDILVTALENTLTLILFLELIYH